MRSNNGYQTGKVFFVCVIALRDIKLSICINGVEIILLLPVCTWKSLYCILQVELSMIFIKMYYICAIYKYIMFLIILKLHHDFKFQRVL